MITKTRRSYVSLTLTLTASTIQNLLTLINAALDSQNAICPDQAFHVSLQSTGGNTASIFVGDSAVSATNAGLELPAGASSAPGIPYNYRAPTSMVPIGNMYTFGTGTSQKINVQVFSF